MPRKFVPKKDVPHDKKAIEEAFNYRVRTGCSYKKACEEFGVKQTTLAVS